jgi:hypothetical protein
VKGRKLHAAMHPDVVAEAKRLRRASPKTGERLSYRKINAKLDMASPAPRQGREGPRAVIVGPSFRCSNAIHAAK